MWGKKSEMCFLLTIIIISIHCTLLISEFIGHCYYDILYLFFNISLCVIQMHLFAWDSVIVFVCL